MLDLPHPWDGYARIQEKLARRSRIDDYSWGLEAGLNGCVFTEEIQAIETVERAVRSESRKERHRQRLRQTHQRDLAPIQSSPLDDAVDARRGLARIQAHVTPEAWVVLRALGQGCDYGEIGDIVNASPGALRARVLRIRRSLAEII